MIRAAFAIPGDKDQKTGGYIYDATVLGLLNESGYAIDHLELPGGFPNPTRKEMSAAIRLLAALPASQPVSVDGLALGAMEPAAIDQIAAPVVALVHHPLGLETGMEPMRAQALIRNEAEVLRRVAHVIVPSRHIAQTLIEVFAVPRERITVAPPGFERPAMQRSPVSPPLILSVGLVVPRKGHDVLIDALSQLANLDWQAEIVGRLQDPAYTAALRRQIEQAGLSERVLLVGEVEGPTLEAAFCRASIFALATRYEGYGMVLSEAMLHGLPVVSCAVGAVIDTVGNAGHLVPPDDAKAFAEQLRKLLDDPDAQARSAQASRIAAASLPRWQETASCFSRVILQVAT